MVDRRISTLIVVMVALTVSCTAIPASGQPGAKDWTLMIYMDADNNLEAVGLLCLDLLEDVGSNEKVNIIVLLDTLSGGSDILYVESDSSMVISDDYDLPEEVDMSNPNTLQMFIRICVTDFKADNYALVIWNHGGGWLGICQDDTTWDETDIYDLIDMNDLRSAFSGALEGTGVIIDVVFFEACNMAMAEVAYQLRDYVDYMVASEETIFIRYPLDDIARRLAAPNPITSLELALYIADDFADWFTVNHGYSEWTISVFDMHFIYDLKVSVSAFAVEMLCSLDEYVNSIQGDMCQVEQYEYPCNIDLKAFADCIASDDMIDDTGIKGAASIISNVIDVGVLSSYCCAATVGSNGLAIYLPSTATSGVHVMSARYASVPFAMDTGWYAFVSAFSEYYGGI